MAKHLIFYDGVCGLCDHAVKFVLWADKNERFVFAPLQGQTAKLYHLPMMKEMDSMVLIEDYLLPEKKVYMMGQAALRTLWLLGGLYRVPGLFYFVLPTAFVDYFYKLIAKNRYRIFGKKECVVFPQKYKGRFLP